MKLVKVENRARIKSEKEHGQSLYLARLLKLFELAKFVCGNLNQNENLPTPASHSSKAWESVTKSENGQNDPQIRERGGQIEFCVLFII